MPTDHPDHNSLGIDQYYRDTYCSDDCKLIEDTEDKLRNGRQL